MPLVGQLLCTTDSLVLRCVPHTGLRCALTPKCRHCRCRHCHPQLQPQARCPLGLKYGCDPTEAEKLLKTAADLGLAVMGVSFHVGSGCK